MIYIYVFLLFKNTVAILIIKILFSISIFSRSKVIIFAIIVCDVSFIRCVFSIWRYKIFFFRWIINRFNSSFILSIIMFMNCLSIFFYFLRGDVVITSANLACRFLFTLCDVYLFTSDSLYFSMFCRINEIFEKFKSMMIIATEELII